MWSAEVASELGSGEATGVAPRRGATITVLPDSRPRRLSHVLVPAAGEAWHSWIHRASADLDVAPGSFVLSLGMPVRELAAAVLPRFCGLAIRADACQQVVAATGLTSRAIDDMHLSRFHGTAVDLSRLNLDDESTVRAVTRTEWIFPWSSRACPRCVASSGVWPLWWQLGLAAVCPHHHLLLVKDCPRCGIPLRRGYRSRARGWSRISMADPQVCGNHLGPARCEQPIAEISTVAAPEIVVSAQRYALAATDGGPVSIAGLPVEASEWFTAVKFLAAMIRFADWAPSGLPAPLSVWSDQLRRHHRPSPHNTGDLRAAPQHPRHAAALLATAHTILSAENREACAREFTELVTAVSEQARTRHRHNPVRAMPIPVPLAEVLAGLQPRPSRVASAAPAVRSQMRLQVANIPQLLDRDEYHRHIAGCLPGTAERTGRRFASLAVVRALGVGSWTQAGTALGMDARRCAQLADVVVRRIDDPDKFWRSVLAAVDALQSQPPIDYAIRRERLAGLRTVPAPVLRTASGGGRSFPVTPQRCGHAAAWVWAHATGGDVSDAPAYATGWDATEESVREGARRFARRLPEPVGQRLLAWAEDMIGRTE